MNRNVYDLSQNYMFVSLLPKNLKKIFLSYVNEDAYHAYKNILNIEDEFLSNLDDARFNILGPLLYYTRADYQLFNFRNQFKISKNKKILFFDSSDSDMLTLPPSGRHLELAWRARLGHVSGRCQSNRTDFLPVLGLENDKFIFFRTSGFRKENGLNVIGMPYIVKDHFSGNYKNKHLSLSYCGWPANNTFKEAVIKKLKDLDYSDFIIRDYWANDQLGNDDGAVTPQSSYNLGPSKKSKQEFIDNMERNLYGLAVRGTSNSSYRLYELFMMGRIPVLLNTDCILPFASEIPYKKNTVFVENFSDIDGQIRKFHDEHTEEELINIQKQNRQIWLEYFRIDGAYNKTKKMLMNSLSKPNTIST